MNPQMPSLCPPGPSTSPASLNDPPKVAMYKNRL
ncbi:hypothetical protein CsSME_00035821 [Camellia sinensis var. sinensis]